VTVVAMASDGGRPSTMASNDERPSTATTAAATTAMETIAAAAATAVARFKRSEIQTHCFSTLDLICWTSF